MLHADDSMSMFLWRIVRAIKENMIHLESENVA